MIVREHALIDAVYQMTIDVKEKQKPVALPSKDENSPERKLMRPLTSQAGEPALVAEC